MSGFLFAVAVGVFVLVAVTRLTQIARRFSRKSLNSYQRDCLRKYSRYYQKLLPNQQYDFEGRVASFISEKKFIPRNFDEVSTEMKVLIAATAIQLTFGLQTVRLRHFQYIVVYPKQFFNPENEQYHFGEVNPRRRAIVLSWENFVETMAEEDGRNLGLHEMAHALELENMIRNGEQDFFDRDVLEKWTLEVSREIERMREGAETIFREYAATDQHEFFATSVELFFEQPQALRDYNDRLYSLLCVLLNQNPLLLNR